MGEEAPESLVNEAGTFSADEFEPKLQDYQTATDLCDKIYVVGGSNNGANLSISVRIFDKSAGKWLIPTVLGMKPGASKSHSAVLLNKDRILILKGGSSLDECTWFLEVDTPFVREQRKVQGGEVVAWSKGFIGDGPKPVVISGPSGVGKGTLISKLMNEFPSTFGFSVSHTTRAPREKEMDGVHYHFTEKSVMEKDIRDGKFLESASVHGNLYGTSIEAVETVADAGKRCILDIDVQGATSVRASLLEAIFIFICPPSFEELEKRLRARGTETEEQIQKRLRNARAELDQGKSPRLFDHILLNDVLETCYENLKKFLAVDEKVDASCQPSMKNFRLPFSHSICKTDQNALIIRSGNEKQKPLRPLFMLGVSSLKGGAPGRTRGLNMYGISS